MTSRALSGFPPGPAPDNGEPRRTTRSPGRYTPFPADPQVSSIAPGRVIGNQPLPHRSVQRRPQRGEQPPRRRRGHPLIEQPPERLLHVADVQLTQQHPIKDQAEVQPDMAPVDAPRAAPQPRPRLHPRLQPAGDQQDTARITGRRDAEPVPGSGSGVTGQVAAPAQPPPPPSACLGRSRLKYQLPCPASPSRGHDVPRRPPCLSRHPHRANTEPRPLNQNHPFPEATNRRDIIGHPVAKGRPSQ